MENDYKNVISNKENEAKTLMTEDQIKKCNVVIHTASGAAVAGDIIPIPVADAIPISAAQITMIVALGKVFGKKISDSEAKAIIVAAVSTFVGSSLAKLIPEVDCREGELVTFGSKATEAIGWIAAVDFAKQSLHSI